MVGMSIFDEGKRLFSDAEEQAGAHPQQAEKISTEAEKLAEKETGGKYDRQIEDVGTKVEQGFEGKRTPGS